MPALWWNLPHMSTLLMRRALAELIGTAVLVFFGAGSVVAALVAGLGRLDYAGLGVIGLSFGLAIAIATYALGTTSGAHINPAVTIALAIVRRFGWRDVPAYIVAQLVGAVIGGLLVVAVFGQRAAQIGGVGLTALSPGVGVIRGMVAEAVGTFLLVLAVMAFAVNGRSPGRPAERRASAGFVGLIIGLAVATAIFVIGPLTGGSVNPARTFGPYLVNTIFGGATPWREIWVYIVGPLVGGACAALAYVAVTQPARGEEAAIPPGGVPVAAGVGAGEGPRGFEEVINPPRPLEEETADRQREREVEAERRREEEEVARQRGRDQEGADHERGPDEDRG
jgi:glycerol uptake facilitator protein